MSVHRLPLEPLIDALHLTLGPSNGTTPGYAITIADLTGAAPATVTRWAKAGGIPDKYADRAAIAIGSHPALIWDDWWEAA